MGSLLFLYTIFCAAFLSTLSYVIAGPAATKGLERDYFRVVESAALPAQALHQSMQLTKEMMDVARYAAEAVTQQAISASVSHALGERGGFKNFAQVAFAQALMRYGLGKVDGLNLDDLSEKIAHTATGAATGALMGGEKGAISGAMGALIANTVTNQACELGIAPDTARKMGAIASALPAFWDDYNLHIGSAAGQASAGAAAQSQSRTLAEKIEQDKQAHDLKRLEEALLEKARIEAAQALKAKEGHADEKQKAASQDGLSTPQKKTKPLTPADKANLVSALTKTPAVAMDPTCQEMQGLFTQAAQAGASAFGTVLSKEPAAYSAGSHNTESNRFMTVSPTLHYTDVQRVKHDVETYISGVMQAIAAHIPQHLKDMGHDAARIYAHIKMDHDRAWAAFKDNPSVENWRQVSMIMVGLGSAAETLGAVSDLVDVAKSIGRKGLRTLGVEAPVAQDIMSCAEGATVFAQPLSVGVRKIEGTAAGGIKTLDQLGRQMLQAAEHAAAVPKPALALVPSRGRPYAQAPHFSRRAYSAVDMGRSSTFLKSEGAVSGVGSKVALDRSVGGAVASKPHASAQATAKATSGLDHVNKKPYDPRAMEAHLAQGLQPGEIMTSSTLPHTSKPNVKLAGREIKLKLVNGSDVIVPFDQRGYAIFDKFSKFETQLSVEIWMSKNRNIDFKEATRHLKDAIDSGSVNPNMFNAEQLNAIRKLSPKIPEYTWHHDLQKIQLVPEIIHNHPNMKHIGGFAMVGQ